MSYATASARCAAAGEETCPFTKVSDYDTCRNGANEPAAGYFWTSEPCQVHVQVDADGDVAVVHAARDAETFVGVDSGNTFRVKWDGDGAFPTTAVSGCAPGCVERSSTCLCNATVASGAVFVDASVVPTSDDVLAALRVGAWDPTAFDAGDYVQCVTDACNASLPDVRVWLSLTGGASASAAGASAAANATDIGGCFLGDAGDSRDDCACSALGGT